MTNEERLKIIDDFFDKHTAAQIHRDMYGDDVESMKKFDKKLWADIIENQVEFNDEDTYYDPDFSEYEGAFCWFHPSVLKEEINNYFQDQECTFPTQEMIITNNGKSIILGVMIGQGTSLSVINFETKKDWCERNKYKDCLDYNKVITLDELEKLIKDSYTEMEKGFYEPDGSLAKEIR